jgi:hypothetical protein
VEYPEAIFRGDEDRKLFLKTLTEACQKPGWRIYAYGLMDNHYHLLRETPEPKSTPSSPATVAGPCTKTTKHSCSVSTAKSLKQMFTFPPTETSPDACSHYNPV